MSVRSRPLLLLAVLLLACLTRCAVNPATGKTQLMLVSESDEIKLGRDNDKQIVAEMGTYEDAELEEYVARIGNALAAESERPDLDWTFRVMDDGTVNAFALPGGYIYVTRGILGYLNSEAELASVLGHEIGHVTARHSASQMSKAQLANIGLVGASVLTPEYAQAFGGLAQASLGMLFLKHSRADETQADDLGLRYVRRSDYDPRPMPEVFDMLRRVSKEAGGQRVPEWQSTHPDPEDREKQIKSKIKSLNKDWSGRRVGRQAYLLSIEDMKFGEDPREGFFQGNRFLHPDMRFEYEFPDGWKTRNMRSLVVGLSPKKDAAIQITMARQGSAERALEKFYDQDGVARTSGVVGTINGLPTVGGGFRASTGQGTMRGTVAFVEHEGSVFRILGYAIDDRWSTYGSAIDESVRSFDRLSDPAALNVKSKRIEIVSVSSPMSLDDFARRFDSTVSVKQLALLNDVSTDATLQPGRYKVVTGGRLP